MASGGGQKGFGLVGEAAVVLVIVFGVGYCQGRGGDGGGDATSDNNDKCEAAWYDANDGEKEDEADPIYKEPWCEQHNGSMRLTAEADQNQELQEAQTP